MVVVSLVPLPESFWCHRVSLQPALHVPSQSPWAAGTMLEERWTLVTLEAVVASMWLCPVWLWTKGPGTFQGGPQSSPVRVCAGTLPLPPQGWP